MRTYRILPSVTCVWLVFAACNLVGGVEGHYTIDRKLSSEALARNVEQELAKMFTPTKGQKAAVPEEILKAALKEASTAFEQLAIDLQIEKGGKFKVTTKIEGSMESAEGTWVLKNDSLELAQTSDNGKPYASPKNSAMKYEHGHLTIQDSASPFPYLVLSRQ